MRHAPAVCDDDGPTITGPMMSRMETIFEKVAKAVDHWSRVPRRRARNANRPAQPAGLLTFISSALFVWQEAKRFS